MKSTTGQGGHQAAGTLMASSKVPYSSDVQKDKDIQKPDILGGSLTMPIMDLLSP